VCREVWDDTGGVISTTTEASASSLQHQPAQSTVAVTSILQHSCHSSQSQQNGALQKPTSVHQSSSAAFTSNLPSSVNRQADQTAGLLAQLQQLVESCRLPDQASSDLMNLFSQELNRIRHTQQAWRHTDSVHISSSGDGGTHGTGLSEVHTTELCSVQNISDVLPPAMSVVPAQMQTTLCAQETFPQSVVATSSDRAATHLPSDHQCAADEMRSHSVDPMSLLTHLEQLRQLQQMYLESATNALHGLYVQQHIVPATSALVDSPSTTLTNAGTFDDAVHNQSSGYIPHSD